MLIFYRNAVLRCVDFVNTLICIYRVELLFFDDFFRVLSEDFVYKLSLVILRMLDLFDNVKILLQAASVTNASEFINAAEAVGFKFWTSL